MKEENSNFAMRMKSFIIVTVFMTMTTLNVMAQNKITQTAGRTQLGEFAPEFARLNDDILFGEVWSRNDLLSLRDRSLVTLTSLISQGITDTSLGFHLQEAKKNGITRTEIAEIITHIAFYAGWPKAWAAFRQAKDVWAEEISVDDAKARFQQEMIFPIGEPNTAYAKYFTGNSYLARISDEQVPIANVTFEPGCRNNWHIHHATKGGGQMLIGVAGRGWYQEWGKPAQEILPGTVIHIPAGVKHWHGAAVDSWFAHLAFEISGENASNEGLEPVTDEECGKVLVAYFSATGVTARAAQKVADATGGEVYAITPAKPYTDADLDWRDKQSRSSVEMNDPKARPALGGKRLDVSEYDVVFIGYPIWWDQAPRIINTFIESHDLKGKTVIPFATSGGSTIAGSAATLKRSYPALEWKEGRLLNRADEKTVRTWVDRLGY